MRCTRRLPDRRLVVLAFVLAGGGVASCSSDDRDTPAYASGADASSDAPSGPVDGGPSPRDAVSVDASPLPIVCASTSCATSLVTTFGRYFGEEGFCAVLKDGTVACWGKNGAGQLGRGEEAGALEKSGTPARVAGLTDIVELDHTCAVDKIGAIWCWGAGPFLRDDTNALAIVHEPVKLPLPPATHVGFDVYVACASVSDGVLCWGYNSQGQIGPFDTTPREAWHPPTPIALRPGAPVRRFAIGQATLILREDGTIVSVGASPSLGRVTSIFPDPYPGPIALEGVSSVEITSDNACAIAGGTASCWGAVSPRIWETGLNLTRALPSPLVTPEPVVQVSTTYATLQDSMPYRWCGATISGAVYCQGFNESGQAGDGKKDYALDPVRVVGLPAPAAQVKVTLNTTCALLTDGTIYCWGSNFDGQLGNGKAKGMALAPEKVILP